MTGGRCSEVDLVLKLLGRDLGWSLLTGGRYSKVVVNTGLTVLRIIFITGEIWKTSKNSLVGIAPGFFRSYLEIFQRNYFPAFFFHKYTQNTV